MFVVNTNIIYAQSRHRCKTVIKTNDDIISQLHANIVNRGVGKFTAAESL